MLLFNIDQLQSFDKQSKFKNISCYCLTAGVTAETELSKNLKTSHVIV